MLRLPWWLAFIVFFPLQVFLAVRLIQSYGFWWALLVLVTLGLAATRAARAPWIREMLFPDAAWRHEERRHIFQGLLLVVALVAWVLVAFPQAWVGAGFEGWLRRGYPWLPLLSLVALVKATVR